jgi:hypothetical protein
MNLLSREVVSVYCFYLTGFSDYVHYTTCELGPSAFMYLATENTNWFNNIITIIIFINCN